MNPAIGQWGPVAVIVGGYLLGIYFQNRRIDDLRDSINGRFDDMNKRFDDVNKRFDDVNKRFDDVNRRFDDVNKRFDRLEHPIVRPS